MAAMTGSLGLPPDAKAAAGPEGPGTSPQPRRIPFDLVASVLLAGILAIVLVLVLDFIP
jgi:hypothetical protein